MKMNKMFAGLIALVTGIALSAGSAFATKGYVGGDPAMMKLVPYYETGDSKATIIGIQNMSPQESSTMTANTAVSDAMTALAAEQAKASPDPTTVANLEKALADANDANYTEHVFIMVNVYDAEGMMMDGASASLCLAEHQFGYVVLQGPEMQDWQMEIPNRGMILTVGDGDIPEYGYVKVMAESRKFTGCGAVAPNRLELVITGQETAAGDTDSDATTGTMNADTMISTWTIIQDTGMGFFGTEVPNATITMRGLAAFEATDDTAVPAMDPILACYSGDDTASTASTPGAIGNRTGDFMMTRCGLIPERHDNTRETEASETDMTVVGGPDHSVVAAAGTRATANSATPRANAFARYDSGDESMVYVWLAEGMDTTRTMPSQRRMLDVVVKCEDGMVVQDMTLDGAPTPIQIPAPTMITMIDPHGDALDPFVHMCEGDRGVLQITMPDKSTAGMVFTHITQMMGHYRMNFPGYSMADPETCYEKGTDAEARKAACD